MGDSRPEKHKMGLPTWRMVKECQGFCSVSCFNIALLASLYIDPIEDIGWQRALASTRWCQTFLTLAGYAIEPIYGPGLLVNLQFVFFSIVI